jgi:orotidine-5'-phosphate decarboxylase
LEIVTEDAFARMGVSLSMQTPKIEARDRLIVALDLSSIEEARDMVSQLDGVVSFFKVGLVLQMAPGAEGFIQELIGSNKKVFLDYKYYDIAETIKKAVARVVKLGVSFLTVHGVSEIIRAAVRGRGNSALKLFSVTVLTSMDQDDLAEMGYTNTSVEELVVFRAKKALEAGCDGVIASGREAGAIKQISDKLLVVTPGIRPDGYPEDDQKRKVTPHQAITAGADYLVVGRPITDAVNPRKQAETILHEMQEAFDERAAISV